MITVGPNSRFSSRRRWLASLGFVVSVGLCAVFLFLYTGGNHPLPSHADTPPDIPTGCTTSSTDSSTDIANYLESLPSGSTMTFAQDACYRTANIELSNLNNITIDGNGSTFKSVGGDRYKGQYPTWDLSDSSNVTFENMTVEGTNKTPKIPGDLQWNSNFTIEGSNNITLNHVHGRDAMGDFVNINDTYYPSDGNPVTRSNNITIENSDSNLTGRNGISCSDCENVTVKNVSFARSGYIGFDLEQDAKTFSASNITITDSKFGPANLAAFNNSGAAVSISNVNISNNTFAAGTSCQPEVVFDSSTPHTNLTISNNTIHTLHLGVSVSRSANVNIDGNTMDVSGKGCSKAEGIYLSNVDGGSASQNDFSGSTSSLKSIVTSKTIKDFTACGNKVPGGSNFDKPTTCSGSGSGSGGGGGGSGGGGGGSGSGGGSGGSGGSGHSSGGGSGKGSTSSSSTGSSGSSTAGGSGDALQPNSPAAKAAQKVAKQAQTLKSPAAILTHPATTIKAVATHPTKHPLLLVETLVAIACVVAAAIWGAKKLPWHFNWRLHRYDAPLDVDRYGGTVPPTEPAQPPQIVSPETSSAGESESSLPPQIVSPQAPSTDGNEPPSQPPTPPAPAA